MIIYALCSNCGTQVSVKSNVIAPQELRKDRGDTFNVNCDNCKSTFVAESMRTRAKKNNLKIMFGLLLSLLVGAFIWNMGYIAGLALAPVIIIYQLEEKSVAAYNQQSKQRYG